MSVEREQAQYQQGDDEFAESFPGVVPQVFVPEPAPDPGPQGSSPSMVGEDFLFYGAGFYTPDMLNGPHKVIGGSQASSLSGGRESQTFLRDSEYYHDDRRSYNTNSSRISLGGSSTASDAYLLARDVYGYGEEGGGEERIPLEEQVAFIKAQQQDMDRQ